MIGRGTHHFAPMVYPLDSIMILTPVAPNQTLLEFDTGEQVFFSYKTPVAGFIPGEGYIRTSKKWSSTTTRHINKYLAGVKAKEVNQETLDNLPDMC